MNSKPQEKAPAHQRESTALHNMKLIFFFLFWAILPSLDRDPDPDLDSGSTDPIELNPGQKTAIHRPWGFNF
jgi:hypothetical protein